jgi:hypothetical protein
VSRELWSAEVVGTIYRLRWQIELTFKYWKSLCHIHVLKGQRPERIECLIYGRLITILLIATLQGLASWYAEFQLQREASMHKITEWLKRNERLSKVVRCGGIERLLEDLIHDLYKMLCKQKRKRKTTRELISNQIPYQDSFSTHQPQKLDKAG